ncbi:MAG: hypothetical protein WBD20_24655 [Pirellulaceae bacterium]
MSGRSSTAAGTSQQPIGLRARADLVISPSHFQGEPSWIVKDPLAMKYFRLRDAEQQVLAMLDGTHSLAEIKTQLSRRMPHLTFDLRHLQQLIQSFHSNGLCLSDAAGQAAPLHRRHQKAQKQKLMTLASSIVSMRFPGIDPDRFLSWLYPKVAWAFSKAFVAACLALIAMALILVLGNWNEFTAKLPQFQQFFGAGNLLFMAALLIGTKSVHELGHGLVCKHFDGECHEMGFMLLVLTPAMYCDTSDSWVLPNKWHRIAIGAAGMWVEVVLAAAATFVWWYTHPGWLHYLSLNLMFLCSFSTIVFNINPLLRYDGYYMLSDYLEIPNLSQKAKIALTNQLRVHALGMEPTQTRMLPERSQLTFATYTMLSFVYRWFVMGMIFWFLIQFLRPYGLEFLAHFAIAVSLFGMIAIPTYRLLKFFLYPGRLREVKPFKATVSLCLLLACLVFVFLVPLPHYVTADFVVKPSEAQSLFVGWNGKLTTIKARYGDRVQAGQVIAELENVDLDLSIMEIESELNRLATLMKQYRLDQTQPFEAARRAGETNAMMKRLTNELDRRRQQQKQLLLVADRDGVLLPPPNVPRDFDDELMLVHWSGQPLDTENLSATLDRQTLVGYVGNPNQMTAMLVIEQSDRSLVREHLAATLRVNSFRHQRLKGKLDSVSAKPLANVPRELSSSNGGPIATMPQPSGEEKPLITVFEASIPISSSSEVRLLPGMTGHAKIHVGSLPVSSRLYRFFTTTFKFQ